MSADQPYGSNGEAEDSRRPPERHPDHSPDRSASQDRGSPPAGDAPGGSRSRAEYAASLRSSGWHDQPPSQPAEPERSQPEHAPDAAPSRRRAEDEQEGTPAQIPGRSQEPNADTPASTRDSDPPVRQEQTSQPREQDLAAGTGLAADNGQTPVR